MKYPSADKNPRKALSILCGALLFCFSAPRAQAFCGFYVAKADAGLYNKNSQVVLVRDGKRSVISMMNDYRGDLKDFALVVPVPQVLEKDQIHVGEKRLFERIDAFTAPRLVEYFDPDPCQVRIMEYQARTAQAVPESSSSKSDAKSLGVTVEASYSVGEYNILILSAEQSDGLERWLRKNGYNIPKGARRALKPYIKQDMKFFVAKVNLKKQAKTGLTYLRPLQMAFESEKFMLPLRLGMLNAQGEQELLVYAISKNGRVESSNYRTVKIPSGSEVPAFIKGEFASFYKAMFDRQFQKEDRRVVFTEYFWNMGWCDPCAADPLSRQELRQLGVFWMDSQAGAAGRLNPRGGAVQAMVTRLHLRYSADSFPEDLFFQETKDRQNFQGRYVIRHPWKGDSAACPAAREYFSQLPQRRETRAQTLAHLTGWDINDIRKKIGFEKAPKELPWWKKLWD